MLPAKGVVFCKIFGRTIDDGHGVRKLAPPFRGVGEEHSDATVDIDERVTSGCPGAITDGIELLFHRVQVGRDGFEAQRTLMEGELAEAFLAHRTGVVDRTDQVDSVTSDKRQHIVGGGVESGCSGCRLPPVALDEAW